VFLAEPGREFELSEALQAAGGTILRFSFDTNGVVTWETAGR
jgi:hypothetical protein